MGHHADTGVRQVARAATLVMALFIVSRILGLVRQMAVGAMFGTGRDLDACLNAARIPEMIFMVITGGALGSAFIPTFADYLMKGDRAGAWRLASAVTNLTLIVLLVASGLTAYLAPPLVRGLLAPGFDAPQQALTVELLRLMLISPIVFGVSGIVMGILNAYQHFLLPALAPSIYNLSIIGGVLLLGPVIGVRGMAWGMVVGSALHLLVQLPALRRYGARYVPTLGLRDPGVREVGRLMLPRMLGTAITQLNFVVNNSLATLIGEGAVSAINYAFLVMLLPQGIFAQAVGTAAFPTFAVQAASGEKDRMRETLTAILRVVFFLCLPATVGLIVLGRPLVGLLFERGAFHEASSEAVTWALSFYALGLVGHAGLEIVARAFYALHDTATPVLVGGQAMVLNVLLSLALPPLFRQAGWPPHAGLALANSVAALLELAVLLALIRRRIGGMGGRGMRQSMFKASLASLAMGGVLYGWLNTWPGANTLIVGGGGVVLGVLVYAAVAFVLRVEELAGVYNLFKRRSSEMTHWR
ncbi:MAG: murein biosynthesis integral membrane protein MurJ [Anaerolineae bacterium]|nr:murein biosynthesis integral membrane protein MurJ [Anaerolineae bacterium]